MSPYGPILNASSTPIPSPASYHGRPSPSLSAIHRRPSSNTPTRGAASARSPGQDAAVSTPKPQTRFVGDLNPEAMFMESLGPSSKDDGSQKYDVGIWLSSASEPHPPNADNAAAAPASTTSNNSDSNIIRTNGTPSAPSTQPQNQGLSQFITSRPPPAMDHFLLPFVRENCLKTVPPDADFIKLRGIYYQKIHPIFPVIPLAALSTTITTSPSKEDDPVEIVIKQLISLAASTDPEAAPYLYLKNHLSSSSSSSSAVPLTPQTFSQTLSSSVRALLETSLITDRVLHIRALTLLSLYTQPTCPEEADLPASLGGRAIHHIQTLGLHLLRYDAPDCDDLESLFCAVWALDRLNAAQYGRPCVIHERDIGTNLESCIRKQEPCFRLLLSVIMWLDQVIELYRPGPTAEASGSHKVAFIDLPVLEAMIVDADALKVPSFLIATIETLYHAVIILSCRLHRPGTLPAASTLPPPSSNARRSLAAERIAHAVPRDHLSPIPFVPYAVSLALSVEYRKMRHSRLPMFRARAMVAFRRNCEMLRGFGDYFWSANVVASLGERVMREMERAATTLTKEKEVIPELGVTASASDTATTTHPSMAENSAVGRASNGDGEDAADGTSLSTNGQSATLQPGANGAAAVAASQDFFPLGDLTTFDTAPGLDNIVDFSLIDAVSGQDVFGHIDPSFNLNAVEEALEANLDIGLPLNWGDWGQFAV